MSWWTRMRSWWQRRGSRARAANQPILREFVYLDDVSVYSLRASQVGLIVTELTETQATSLQGEARSSIGINTGLAKGEVGSAIHAGETQESQVLRKAVVQTTFKQMYDDAAGALLLSPLDSEAPLPRIETAHELERLATDESQSWVIHPSRLSRGDLIEVEVLLEAEPIFHAGAIVSAVHEIIKDDPSMFGLSDTGQLSEVRVVSRLVEKLLAGLVPVRGRLVDYEIMSVGDDELLVHRAIMDQLQTDSERGRPFLVGVAEKGLFWKDVRRVLFTGSPYRVLGRITGTGLERSWTPVKLVDVMRGVMPEFAEIIDEMNRGVLSAMSTAVAAQQSDSTQRGVQEALAVFAELIAEHADDGVSPEDLANAGLLQVPDSFGDLSIPKWRRLTAPITAYMQERTGGEIESAVVAQCRTAALATAYLLPGERKTKSLSPKPQDPHARYLDVEIVAVYW